MKLNKIVVAIAIASSFSAYAAVDPATGIDPYQQIINDQVSHHGGQITHLQGSVADLQNDQQVTERVLFNQDARITALENSPKALDGKDGKDGVNGMNGIDGKDGANGKDGKDGQNGIDGKDGKDGANGLDGKDGKDGVNGTNGKDGLDGKDGHNGIDGKDGKDGLNGKDGAKGDTGVTGAKGADGKDGRNGKDADMTVVNKNTSDIKSLSIDVTAAAARASDLDKRIAEQKVAQKKTNDTVAAHSRQLADHETRLGALESNTNSQFSDLKNRIDDNKREADAGIAGVAAMANIPQVTESQTFAIGAGAGTREGESAIAVGFSARASQSVVVKASVAGDTQQSWTVGAGVSYGW